MDKSDNQTNQNNERLSEAATILAEYNRRAWKCWMWALLVLVLAVFICKHHSQVLNVFHQSVFLFSNGAFVKNHVKTIQMFIINALTRYVIKRDGVYHASVYLTSSSSKPGNSAFNFSNIASLNFVLFRLSSLKLVIP